MAATAPAKTANAAGTAVGIYPKAEEEAALADEEAAVEVADVPAAVEVPEVVDPPAAVAAAAPEVVAPPATRMPP